MSDEQVISSFADLLPPETVTLNIETEYGRAVTVRTGVLSYDDWEAARRKLVMPRPPKNLENPNKAGEFFPNPDDPVYKDNLRAWSDNSVFYQVIVALERGGMVIPGNTPLEKVREFRKIDTSLAMGIVDGVTRIHAGRKARVDNLADSFPEQPMDTSEDAGDVAVEYQNGHRVEPIAAE